MGPATVYRSSKGLSFELSGVFVLVQEVNEKNYAASCLASPGLGMGQITRYFWKMMKWNSNHKSIIDSRIISFLLYICTLVKFKLSKSLTLDNGTDFAGSHFQTAHAITFNDCIRCVQTKASHYSEDDGKYSPALKHRDP